MCKHDVFLYKLIECECVLLKQSSLNRSFAVFFMVSEL